MKVYLVIISFYISSFVLSQNIPPDNLRKLREIESNIKGAADSIVNTPEWLDRFRADSIFTRGLVQALKVPYSIYYPFDSIKTISKLLAPDSSFRIYTWQVMKDYEYYRQRGAIQMRTDDGSLKLFPLFDVSEFTKSPTDSVRDAKHWIGAIYYKIILKTFNNRKYYTLIGSDENNGTSNKKWIDILTFDERGIPEFGGRLFNYPNDEIKPKQPVYRFCLEFKKDGGARMNYDERYDAIIFDHLTSDGNDPKNRSTLIPYGDYEGFRWINGAWKYVSNPFANVIFDDKQSTFPKPLLDDKGLRNEKQLEEQSQKNQKKGGN